MSTVYGLNTTVMFLICGFKDDCDVLHESPVFHNLYLKMAILGVIYSSIPQTPTMTVTPLAPQ